MNYKEDDFVKEIYKIDVAVFVLLTLSCVNTLYSSIKATYNFIKKE